MKLHTTEKCDSDQREHRAAEKFCALFCSLVGQANFKSAASLGCYLHRPMRIDRVPIKVRQNVQDASWGLFNATLVYRFIARLSWARGVLLSSQINSNKHMHSAVEGSRRTCNIWYYGLAGRLVYGKSMEKSAINLERDKSNHYGPKRHENFWSRMLLSFMYITPTEKKLRQRFMRKLLNFTLRFRLYIGELMFIQETERLLHQPRLKGHGDESYLLPDCYGFC